MQQAARLAISVRSITFGALLADTEKLRWTSIHRLNCCVQASEAALLAEGRGPAFSRAASIESAKSGAQASIQEVMDMKSSFELTSARYKNGWSKDEVINRTKAQISRMRGGHPDRLLAHEMEREEREREIHTFKQTIFKA